MTPKEQVLRFFPNAKVKKSIVNYIVKSGTIDLGRGKSYKQSWLRAYINLLKP